MVLKDYSNQKNRYSIKHKGYCWLYDCSFAEDFHIKMNVLKFEVVQPEDLSPLTNYFDGEKLHYVDIKQRVHYGEWQS